MADLTQDSLAELFYLSYTVAAMSFEQYSQFPQGGQQENVPGQVQPQQDGVSQGQQNDQPGGQQMSFSPENGGPSQPGQGGEQKTTLWYVVASSVLKFTLTKA